MTSHDTQPQEVYTQERTRFLTPNTAAAAPSATVPPAAMATIAPKPTPGPALLASARVGDTDDDSDDVTDEDLVAIDDPVPDTVREGDTADGDLDGLRVREGAREAVTDDVTLRVPVVEQDAVEEVVTESLAVGVGEGVTELEHVNIGAYLPVNKRAIPAGVDNSAIPSGNCACPVILNHVTSNPCVRVERWPGQSV